MGTPTRTGLRSMAPLAGLILFCLLILGAVVFLTVRKSALQSAVEQAGGEYQQDQVARNPLDAMVGFLFGQRPTVFTWISFEGGTVDDLWFAKHGDSVAASPYVFLVLNDTGVTAAGLEPLRGSENLIWMNLCGTPLDVEVLPLIASLPNCNTVGLARTGLPGETIGQLSNMPHLVSLVLDGRQLTEETCQVVAGFPHLVVLTVAEATDEAVLNLQRTRSPKVKHLTLRGEQLTGQSVAILHQFTGLEILNLWGTGITDPKQIQDLKDSLPDCTVQVLSDEELEALEESY